MRPPSRPILGLIQSISVEGPLLGRLPIGRFQGCSSNASRRFSVASKQLPEIRKANAKSWRRHSYVEAQYFSSSVRRKAPNTSAIGGIATSPKRSNTSQLLGVLFGASALAFVGSSLISNVDDQHDNNNPIGLIGSVDIVDENDVRKIRLVEVPEHDRNAPSKWVVRGTSVYDITDFVEQHPGGEVILRACGGTIDPYWKIFSIHQKPEVYDILNQFYIGDIDERDLNESGHVDWNALGSKVDAVDDPFKYEPERDPSLIFRTEKPCNAETPGDLLTDFLTPLKLFFVRNHLWVPQTHESPKSITIELSDGEEKTYTLEDLKVKFKEHTITVTLQCSGNRRSHMSKAAPGPTSGLQWDVGAIGTADFSGVRLRDVLKDAGYCVDGDCPAPKQCDSQEADQHVHFTSPADTYAVSIPLQTAINPQADVLLAWDMNGEPINRDHGGPLRAIVPGVTAARSVKWLGKVNISCDESQSQWQKRDYKCFGPNIKQSQVRGEDWDEAESIQETPVQSAITKIVKAEGNSQTSVNGFAFSGGGRRIVRVDVSADGGKTWKQADLHNDKAKGSRRWAWTLWTIDWPMEELKPGQKAEFVVKAVDDAYNTQPQSFDDTWNFRGLCANAWMRVAI